MGSGGGAISASIRASLRGRWATPEDTEGQVSEDGDRAIPGGGNTCAKHGGRRVQCGRGSKSIARHRRPWGLWAG